MYVPSHCLDKSEPVEQEGRLWSAVHSFGSIFLLMNFVNLRKAIIVAVLHARNFVNNIFVIQEVARCETASSGGPQLFWPPTVRKRKRASWGDEASQNAAVWLLWTTLKPILLVVSSFPPFTTCNYVFLLTPPEAVNYHPIPKNAKRGRRFSAFWWLLPRNRKAIVYYVMSCTCQLGCCHSQFFLQ